MWFDEATVEMVTEVTPLWAAIVLLLVGYLGSVYFVAPTVAVAYLKGTSWKTATWPGIVLGGYGLFATIKSGVYVERPPVDPPFTAEVFPLVLRPLYHLAVQFDTGAFPSGHVLIATVLWGLLVVDLQVRTLWERLAGAAVVVGLISYSRVALGLHYVDDVVGGVVLGALFLGIMLFVRQRASTPANATLLVAFVPVVAGFPAGTPLEAGALLVALVAVYLLNQYTDVVRQERLAGRTPAESHSQSSRGVDPNIENRRAR